jgi:inward rectifier potassium channel
MAIFKDKGERELGFGSTDYKNSVRYINRDGSVNVKRGGLGGLANLDIYHWLISASARKLSLLLFSGYFLINLIFGSVYFMIGSDQFGGIDLSSPFQEFMSLFFFSAQTITTLGYGHIYPVGNQASVVAAIESLLGLMSFAIATGIIFGRFSRPRADILYSRNILIAPYRDISALMFRVTNKKQYELIETEASVTLTIRNPETHKREFFNLELEIKRINFFALSWTIVHPINEQSPLHGLGVKELEDRDAEILILIKAINDTVSQTVYSRYSYKHDDVVEKAKFKPVRQEPNRNGMLRISVMDIHHYESLS